MPEKVFLMNPPSGLYRRDDRCQNAVEDQTVRIILPPMSLAYIAAIHLQSGDICRIVDYPAEKKSIDDLRKDIFEFMPDRLYVGVTTATIDRDMETIRMAKSIKNDIIAIAFGFYFKTFGKEIMEKHPELDIAIFSEIEGVVSEYLKIKDISKTSGLYYREGNEIIKNGDFPGTENPDTLPFPARNLLKNDIYVMPDTNNPVGVITTSRGCAFRCIFCPAGKLTNYKIFHRSAENIYEEIKECFKECGIKEFLFNADTFTAKKETVLRLCRLIEEERLSITFAINSRVDTVDEELLTALKKAGCKMVAFGVESGSQMMLDKMKKNIKLCQAKKAISLCKKVGLLAHTFYIIGLPWETKETLNATLEFAKELDADFFDFNIAYPLPGTDFFDIAKKDGLFEGKGLNETSYASSPVCSYALSNDELLTFRKNALRGLFFRPGYILKTLARVAKEPKVLFRYIRVGVKKLKLLNK